MFPIDIEVSEELKNKCPNFRGAAVYALVENTTYSDDLWKEIATFTQRLIMTSDVEAVKQQPAIAATRNAYKCCGKDPSRYRPAGESLRRRLLRGFDLYQINTLVDVVNFVSLDTGFSIGGIDADKIVGPLLTLGIGKAREPYEGIGRGQFNIEGIPVYRDKKGGIATPTSDNERTKMELITKHILVIINSYNGEEGLKATVSLTKKLLKNYANASLCEVKYYK